MAKLIDPDDLDGEMEISKRVIQIDNEDVVVYKFAELRLQMHNYLWGTEHRFPDTFNDEDMIMAMDILSYGETNWGEPKENVIEWVEMIIEQRENGEEK